MLSFFPRDVLDDNWDLIESVSESFPTYSFKSHQSRTEKVRVLSIDALLNWGWSGGAMVLDKLPVPGRPTIWITVGQGPTALTVGAGGGCLDIFSLLYPFSPLSPSLWETARYRLKYCLKGSLNPKQPTNQPTLLNCRHDFFVRPEMTSTGIFFQVWK